MFDNISNLFIALNSENDLSVWRDGDNPNGPDELVERRTLDPMVWDVLDTVLPHYFECEVCGMVNEDDHDNAACRNSQDNWPGSIL